MGDDKLKEPVDAILSEARSAKFLFHRQVLHAALLVLLVSVGYALAAPALGPCDTPLLGLCDCGWFWLTLGVAVVHQLLVWLVFRGQLGWGVLTRLFGHRDLLVWGSIFIPLLIARPLATLGIAIADRGSLALPFWLSISLAVVLLVPATYAMYSVIRFFGIPRALGGDHFRLRYRRMPMVRKGAFAWTSNAMYLLVFLGLWSIAFITRSQVALVAALFQHAYVWVHFYCTEKPDMDLMYG